MELQKFLFTKLWLPNFLTHTVQMERRKNGKNQIWISNFLTHTVQMEPEPQ